MKIWKEGDKVGIERKPEDGHTKLLLGMVF